MSKLQNPKRIRVEDFEPDDQNMANKIADSVNDFMDEVFYAFSKGIDFENMNRDLIVVDVKIDSSGKVIQAPQVKYNLRNGRVRGVNVVNAQNLLNPIVYPVQTPFVSWLTQNNTLIIQNVTGLQNNSQYRLTLELIG